MLCKSNNNSYHDDTNAFFSKFFSKKTRTLMPLSMDDSAIICDKYTVRTRS